MIKFKILQALSSEETILKFNMDGVLKEVKRETFNPPAEKRSIYNSKTKNPSKTPLVKTGEFRKSFFVGESSVKTKDKPEKVKAIKKRLGSKYFRISFKKILRHLTTNL
jgi:hypothetical protein